MQDKMSQTKLIIRLLKGSCVQAKRGSGNVCRSMFSVSLNILYFAWFKTHTAIIQPATALCLRELYCDKSLSVFIFRPALYFSGKILCGNKKNYYLCSDICSRIKRTFL